MTDKCFECSESATQNHHVVPRSLGGTKTIPLCDKCHNKVHSRKQTAISTLTKKALNEKRKKNERIGTIPWGFKEIKGKLVPYKKELELIDLCKKMKDSGLTLKQIAEDLNKKNITLRGKKLYEVKVHRLLKFLKDQK